MQVLPITQQAFSFFFAKLTSWPKIYTGVQKTQNSIDIFKENKITGLRFPDFKVTYSETIIIKILWFWHKDRCIDRWNRIENVGIHTYI